jgi:UDP-MurNAc hydroxylase
VSGVGLRIELLGHASMLVRTEDAVVLVDPLLFGVHQEGTYDIYPRRQLDIAKLPPIDALVITHAHLDHFDPPSLATIPRSVPVIVPRDEILIGALQALGFEKIEPVAPFATMGVGSLTLMSTPPAPGAVEMGVVLQHGGVTAWNLVDTVPPVEKTAEVLRRVGRVDVAIAPWQPLQDLSFFRGEPAVFPHAVYRQLLANVAQIRPGFLVAGACGFCAVDEYAFVNSLIFPVTRARAMHDVQRLCPELRGRVAAADPGCVIEIGNGGDVRVEPSALAYCRAEPYAWEKLAFRPFEMGFPVRELRGAPFSAEACGAAVAAFFEEALAEHVQERRPAFEWHRRYEVRHQFEVVFHGGKTRHWLLDLSSDPPRVTEERSPLALGHTVIAASTLLQLVAGTVSLEHASLSGQLRLYDCHYKVTDAGLLDAPPVFLANVLHEVFGGGESMERMLSSQLSHVIEAVQGGPAADNQATRDAS